jgi:uncharacterized RDD family membrane protein YckC
MLQQEDLLNIDELQISHTYGKFWPRFWALLIDALILAVLTPLVLYNKSHWNSGFLLIIIASIQISYKPFFEWRYGATPGKMALRLKVVNYDYAKASLNEILLRNAYQVAGGLVGFCLQLYSFYQPASLQTQTPKDYFNLGNPAFAAVVLQVVVFIVYLVDFGFLVNSPNSRSLHDRIGKTFVIRE